MAWTIVWKPRESVLEILVGWLESTMEMSTVGSLIAWQAGENTVISYEQPSAEHKSCLHRESCTFGASASPAHTVPVLSPSTTSPLSLSLSLSHTLSLSLPSHQYIPASTAGEGGGGRDGH